MVGFQEEGRVEDHPVYRKGRIGTNQEGCRSAAAAASAA
jgi:hypothetical protein